MKNIISIISCGLIALNAFAIDPFGSRMDYGDNGMTIPTLLILLGLIIATIGSFWMGSFKNKDGIRETPGMLWLGILGVIGIVSMIGKIS